MKSNTVIDTIESKRIAMFVVMLLSPVAAVLVPLSSDVLKWSSVVDIAGNDELVPELDAIDALTLADESSVAEPVPESDPDPVPELFSVVFEFVLDPVFDPL